MKHTSPARKFFFSSRLRREYYNSLEKMLFFNKKQPGFLQDIERSIDEYGVPLIVEEGEILRIRTSEFGEMQNLFVFDDDAEDANLIGAVVYFRRNLRELVVLHIVVDEDYSFSGKFSDKSLTRQMINRVREVALKIRGIERVNLAYGDFAITVRE